MKPRPSVEELKERLSYDPETGIFTSLGPYRHGRKVGYIDDNGYVRIKFGASDYERAHRLAWLFVHGHLPAEIDHINGDKTDNRIANLRPASRAENQHNRCSPKVDARTAKTVGVHWYKPGKCWCAQIQANKKKHHLGYYPTIEAAHAAYCKAKDELHPTHRRLRNADT